MKKIIIYVFLFLFVLIVFSIVSLLNTYFSDRVKLYIENRGTVYTQEFIQNSISENVIKNIKISDLYLINTDTNDQVKSVIINTYQINNILSLVNKSLQKDILSLEKETISIPFATIFGETLFSNIGPDVNVKIQPLGKYKCDVITNVTEYGINNSLFEIYISINIDIETIIPLIKIDNTITCKIPIVMQILHGEVPRYYYNTDKLVPDVYDPNNSQ